MLDGSHVFNISRGSTGSSQRLQERMEPRDMENLRDMLTCAALNDRKKIWPHGASYMTRDAVLFTDSTAVCSGNSEVSSVFVSEFR